MINSKDTKKVSTFNSRSLTLLLGSPITIFKSIITYYLMHAMKPNIFKIKSFTDVLLLSVLVTLVFFISESFLLSICKYEFFARCYYGDEYDENDVIVPEKDYNLISSILIGGALFPILFLHYHMALATSILLACTPIFLQILSNIFMLDIISFTAVTIAAIASPFVLVILLQHTLFPGVDYGTLFGYLCLATIVGLICSEFLTSIVKRIVFTAESSKSSDSFATRYPAESAYTSRKDDVYDFAATKGMGLY